MKFELVKERDVPADLKWKWERASAALHAGVDWTGSVESIGGLTTDEAIGVAVEFIDAFGEWLRSPE